MEESHVPLSDAGFPEYYEKTVLRALPCNPSQLFVYWELPRRAAVHCTALTLTLFEAASVIDATPLPLFELSIDPQLQSYYLTVPTAGSAYTVALIAAFSGGGRATLRSSGTLQLPGAQQRFGNPEAPLESTAFGPGPAIRPAPSGVTTGVNMSVPPSTAPANPSSWSCRKQQQL